jgi:ribonuclease D
LAILRELAAWREAQAEQKNRPRGRIIPDEVLVELARRAPTDRPALQSIRVLNPGIVKRQADEILKAVRRGLQVPEIELPSLPKRSTPVSAPPGLVDLLSTVLRARAEQLQIAPGILAKRGDLERMAIDSRCVDYLPVLQGWRLDLVGRELLDVLNGRRLVGFDISEQKVKTFPTEEEDRPQ